MITKKDALGYLEKMKALELQMERVYKELFEKVLDKELKKIFEEMAKDEKAHAKVVQDLMDLVQSKWKS